MKVKECADLLGVSQQFIRIGLQRGQLPFGTAVQMSKKWTYHIAENAVHHYLEYGTGGAGGTDEKAG